MKIMISGEQPFQVLSDNFSISPSNEGYTLQISADGIEFSDLFAVAADTTRMVTDVANGSYYRLAGNASDVTVNWNRSCGGGEGGGGGEYVLPKASATRLGGVKVGENLSIDENGVLSATGGSGSSLPEIELNLGWNSETSVWELKDYNEWTTENLLKYLGGMNEFDGQTSQSMVRINLRNDSNEVCAIVYPEFVRPNGDFRTDLPTAEIYFTFTGPNGTASSEYNIWKYLMVPNYYYYGDSPTITFIEKKEYGGGGSSQPSVYFIDFLSRTATGGDADWAKFEEMYNRAAAGDFGFTLNVKYDGTTIGNLVPRTTYYEDYSGDGIRFDYMYVTQSGTIEYGNGSDWSGFMVRKNEEAHTITCEKISKTI